MLAQRWAPDQRDWSPEPFVFQGEEGWTQSPQSCEGWLGHQNHTCRNKQCLLTLVCWPDVFRNHPSMNRSSLNVADQDRFGCFSRGSCWTFTANCNKPSSLLFGFGDLMNPDMKILQVWKTRREEQRTSVRRFERSICFDTINSDT